MEKGQVLLDSRTVKLAQEKVYPTLYQTEEDQSTYPDEVKDVDQDVQQFQLPEDIVLNQSDQNLFTYLQSMPREDIPVYYYF